MDIDALTGSLVVGRIPKDWPAFAANSREAFSNSERIQLVDRLDAFVAHLLRRLDELRSRLVAAGFQFQLPDDHLRRTTEEDDAALNRFIEQHGPVPLSVEAWYRRIASFSFAQHGAQMFDRNLPFYFMNRCLEFTMPPIERSCSSRWEEEGESFLTDDGRLFFPVEECWMDEDCKGFELPNACVDPVIDARTGTTFLQWADFQVSWGGFGKLASEMRKELPGEFSAGLDLNRLGELFQIDRDEWKPSGT